MSTDGKANIGGWVVLAVGVVATVCGVIVFWILWDVPPADVNQRYLLLPFLVGLPCVGFGLYSVIRREPLDSNSDPRYPYFVDPDRRAQRDPAPSGNERS